MRGVAYAADTLREVKSVRVRAFGERFFNSPMNVTQTQIHTDYFLAFHLNPKVGWLLQTWMLGTYGKNKSQE
jgi:hypothetical protein